MNQWLGDPHRATAGLADLAKSGNDTIMQRFSRQPAVSVVAA